MHERLIAARQRIEALPPLVVDSALAVVCFLATVAVPVKVMHEGGWRLVALAGLASVPLIWRRRAPVQVCAVIGLGTMGLALTRMLLSVPLPYGQVAATYTVAALAPPLWRWITLAVTVGCILTSVLLIFQQRPAVLGLAALPFLVAYSMGVSARARRVRISMLEERTRRLAESAQAMAVRERERIAREIHDIVAHSVSLMVVQAEAGLVQAGDRAKAAGTFETISDTGREALGQLDRALGLLRDDGPLGWGERIGPSRHPAPGLQDLPDLVERARPAGLDGELVEHGPRWPVPADLATAVYRLVQEAVTNTVKHADAGRFRVRLDWRAAALAVTVDDDGRGPVACAPGTGRGLIGMRERVEAFGGELTTGARPDGAGFRVAAVFPHAGGGDG